METRSSSSTVSVIMFTSSTNKNQQQMFPLSNLGRLSETVECNESSKLVPHDKGYLHTYIVLNYNIILISFYKYAKLV